MIPALPLARLVDMSNTKQFNRLVVNSGHPPARRYLIALMVHEAHPDWFTLHSCHDYRNHIAVPLPQDKWELQMGGTISCFTPNRLNLDWPIPALWLGTKSQAHSAMARMLPKKGLVN